MNIIFGILPFALFMAVNFPGSEYMTLRVKKWTAGILCILLLASAVVYAALPKDQLEQPVSPEILSASQNLRFIDLASGNYDKNYITNIKKQQFDYYGRTLKLNFDCPKKAAVLYKDTDDDLIEVTYFASPCTISDYEITSQMKLPEAELDGDELTLRELDNNNIHKSQFTYEFTIRQFLDGGKDDEKEENGLMSIGDRYILIRLPKGLQLSGNANVQIIDG